MINTWKTYILRNIYITLLHNLRKRYINLSTDLLLNTVLKSNYDLILSTFFLKIFCQLRSFYIGKDNGKQFQEHYKFHFVHYYHGNQFDICDDLMNNDILKPKNFINFVIYMEVLL